MASIIGAMLFLPHLYWQYVNDFPSVQYHLVDRSAKAYDYSFTGIHRGANYFPGRLLTLFLYWQHCKLAKDLFEKLFKYSIGGTFVFFHCHRSKVG